MQRVLDVVFEDFDVLGVIYLHNKRLFVSLLLLKDFLLVLLPRCAISVVLLLIKFCIIDVLIFLLAASSFSFGQFFTD